MAVAWPGNGQRGRWHVPSAWAARLWLTANYSLGRAAMGGVADDGAAPETPDTADTSDARGDADAFDALFAAHERQVYGYLWRVTGDRHVASDLCQETFLRAWQHIARVRDYEQPLGWLLHVATHLALNARRRRATRVGVPVALDEANSPALGDPAVAVVEHDQVHRVLLALPPKMRAALVLREVYGLSCEEVAEMLGSSLAAAKMLLSRAREQFRQRYQREEGRP